MPWIIQNLCHVNINVYDGPAWPALACSFSTISLAKACRPGKIIGCLVPSGSAALSSLPFTCNIKFGPTLGRNLRRAFNSFKRCISLTALVFEPGFLTAHQTLQESSLSKTQQQNQNKHFEYKKLCLCMLCQAFKTGFTNSSFFTLTVIKYFLKAVEYATRFFKEQKLAQLSTSWSNSCGSPVNSLFSVKVIERTVTGEQGSTSSAREKAACSYKSTASFRLMLPSRVPTSAGLTAVCTYRQASDEENSKILLTRLLMNRAGWRSGLIIFSSTPLGDAFHVLIVAYTTFKVQPLSVFATSFLAYTKHQTQSFCSYRFHWNVACIADIKIQFREIQA